MARLRETHKNDTFLEISLRTAILLRLEREEAQSRGEQLLKNKEVRDG